MSRTARSAVQALLILAGVAMIAIGILQGEPVAVLRKAVYVCLECIGIG